MHNKIYWDIVDNTRTSNEEPNFVWWPTFMEKYDDDLEDFCFIHILGS